jgi:F0F1-type ATP synthase assembly protein I
MPAPDGGGQNAPPAGRTPLGSALREFAPYLTLGFQLAAAVVVFLLIGVWLDNRLDSSPWFKLAGLLLGITGGFIKFFKTVSELEKHRKKKP